MATLILLAVQGAQAASPDTVDEKSCALEEGKPGPIIGKVSIKAPLALFPWARAEVAAAELQLSNDLSGQPYDKPTVLAAVEKVEKFNFANPDGDARLNLRYVKAVAICEAGTAEVRSYFFVLRAQPGIDLGTTGARMRATATVGYDRAERTSLGVQGDATSQGGTAIAFDARKSADAHSAVISLGETRDFSTGAFINAEWKLGYLDTLEPTVLGGLRHEGVAASGSATSRPWGAGAWTLRLGSSFERGRYSFDGSPPSPQSSASKSFRSLKAYSDARRVQGQFTWAVAYGIERGELLSEGRHRWTKQVVDLSSEGTFQLPGSLRMSVEARVGAGHIAEGNSVPVEQRFLGGGREKFFVPGDSQSPRAAPLMRGMGNAELGAGQGATRFRSLNLTAAVPVRRWPLVPKDFSESGFRDELDAQLQAATNQLQTTYEGDDPRFRSAVASLDTLRGDLGSLKDLVASEQPSAAPEILAKAFKDCLNAISMADRRARETLEAKTNGAKRGFLNELLSSDDPEAANRLAKVGQLCGNLTSSVVATTKLANISKTAELIRRDIASINTGAAQQKAKRELAPAKQALTTILDQMDFASLSPLMMLDAVRLDDRQTRYGLGLGVRATLINSVELDIGYMKNRRQAPQEPSGALFVRLKMKDIF